jgi:hypothetical protein
MIIALAGRRVDAIDASPPRFPLKHLDKVSAAVRALLEHLGATAVVSSAACGADLISLSVAGKLGLRRRVVLPFNREKFRETSVVDRPGVWGELYDSILDEVEAFGDLVVLDNLGNDDPYLATSWVILDEAVVLGRERDEPVGAALVWDGVSRGATDYTDKFGAEARRRGLAVFEISTVGALNRDPLGSPR